MMSDDLECHRDYLRLVARFLWNPALQRQLDLSDIVQITLLKALQNTEQYRGNTDTTKRAWLRTILRNVLFEKTRGNPPGEVSLVELSSSWEQQTSPGESLRREEQLLRLAAALARLAEDERTAVELKHLHGCSVAFISEHMGRTEHAVAGLLKRGMARLRKELGQSS
jgi:RNA polymerase sigma-70 factor (ECF subfamily)